MRVFLFYYIEW